MDLTAWSDDVDVGEVGEAVRTTTLVGPGRRVVVRFPGGDEIAVLLVPRSSVSVEDGETSMGSPLAQSLHGGAVGEVRTASGPQGVFDVAIVGVELGTQRVNNTGTPWTDASLNPITGFCEILEGCAHSVGVRPFVLVPVAVDLSPTKRNRMSASLRSAS